MNIERAELDANLSDDSSDRAKPVLTIEERLDVAPQRQQFPLMNEFALKRCWLCDHMHARLSEGTGLCPDCREELVEGSRA